MPQVKIRNVGSADVTLRHDAHGDVTIAPGKAADVDFEVALVNLGNPAAEGDPNVELTRVQQTWGFHRGLTSEAWTDAAPAVEVYDDDGNRLFMLHDDPTGERAAEAAAKPKRKDEPPAPVVHVAPTATSTTSAAASPPVKPKASAKPAKKAAR